MTQYRNITHALCTLFDHNYLDKGLVLYDSLEAHGSDFTLYVLAMSDKCYEVLTDLMLPHLKPIKLSDFENEQLLSIKNTRSFAEYCWTCGSSFVKYIFDRYEPDYCSYIDTDMAFYEDPFILIEELNNRNASVSIVGHRFCWFAKKKSEAILGKYCVECNTFKNDTQARNLLDLWVSQCIECCSAIPEKGLYGDQKYLANWCTDYDFVIETQNMGAGVAPWNISQYRMISHDAKTNTYLLRNSCKDYKLLFYHYENIQYLSRYAVNVNVYSKWGLDDNLVKSLYGDYLQRLEEKKSLLESKYGLSVIIKRHPGKIVNRPKSLLGKIWNILCVLADWKSVLFERIPTRLYHKKDIFNINNRILK